MAKPVYRHELKYYITAASAELLKRRLSVALKNDNNAVESGRYYIRSLYFDNIYSGSYYDKIEGVRDRDKYRIRYYNFDSSYIALEKKIKNDDLIYKRSVVINKKLCLDILNKNIFGLMDMNNRLLREFYIEMRLNNLHPHILVDYYRSAYEFPVNDVRITIDENLKTALWNTALFDENLPLIPAIDSNEVILEVKYNKTIPLHVVNILNCVGKDRCSISKYTLCSRYLH